MLSNRTGFLKIYPFTEKRIWNVRLQVPLAGHNCNISDLIWHQLRLNITVNDTVLPENVGLLNCPCTCTNSCVMTAIQSKVGWLYEPSHSIHQIVRTSMKNVAGGRSITFLWEFQLDMPFSLMKLSVHIFKLTVYHLWFSPLGLIHKRNWELVA